MDGGLAVLLHGQSLRVFNSANLVFSARLRRSRLKPRIGTKKLEMRYPRAWQIIRPERVRVVCDELAGWNTSIANCSQLSCSRKRMVILGILNDLLAPRQVHSLLVDVSQRGSYLCQHFPAASCKLQHWLPTANHRSNGLELVSSQRVLSPRLGLFLSAVNIEMPDIVQDSILERGSSWRTSEILLLAFP